MTPYQIDQRIDTDGEFIYVITRRDFLGRVRDVNICTGGQCSSQNNRLKNGSGLNLFMNRNGNPGD